MSERVTEVHSVREAVRFSRREQVGRAARPLALATGLALSACSGTAAPESAHSFPESAARDLFTDGYRHVLERYIEPVHVDELALAGFRGLESAAPDLAVSADGNRVSVFGNGRYLQEFERPKPDDSEGWAGLTAAVLQTAWSESEALRVMDPEDVYSSVFTGMLNKLDGYSRYTDARSSENARASRDGFGGIGITVSTIDSHTTIVQVIPGGPASRAGLQDGDRILAVDGRPVMGQPHDSVIDLLRGGEGTSVALTVGREASPAPLTVSLVREHIVPQTVLYRREGDVAYFRLTSFNRHTTADLSRLVAGARSEIGPAMAGIVLDLRSNPGGLLDQAVGVADLFLSKGTIIATRGRHPASNSAFTATDDDIAEGLPIVVLINGRSASASELLAAALQDQGRAVVVGSSTHGKGSVQNVARLPNGGEFIVTWSRMVAPSGYILDRLGVMPSVCTSGEQPELSPGSGIGITPASAVEAWHGYASPDEAVARTLRLGCPSVADEPNGDLRLAEQVLRDTRLYADALQPWVGTVTASAGSDS